MESCLKSALAKGQSETSRYVFQRGAVIELLFTGLRRLKVKGKVQEKKVESNKPGIGNCKPQLLWAPRSLEEGLPRAGTG